MNRNGIFFIVAGLIGVYVSVQNYAHGKQTGRDKTGQPFTKKAETASIAGIGIMIFFVLIGLYMPFGI